MCFIYICTTLKYNFMESVNFEFLWVYLCCMLWWFPLEYVHLNVKVILVSDNMYNLFTVIQKRFLKTKQIYSLLKILYMTIYYLFSINRIIILIAQNSATTDVNCYTLKYTKRYQIFIEPHIKVQN